MGGFTMSVALTVTTLSCLSQLTLAGPTTSPLVGRDEVDLDGQSLTPTISPVKVRSRDEGGESGTAIAITTG